MDFFRLETQVRNRNMLGSGCAADTSAGGKGFKTAWNRGHNEWTGFMGTGQAVRTADVHREDVRAEVEELEAVALAEHVQDEATGDRHALAKEHELPAGQGRRQCAGLRPYSACYGLSIAPIQLRLTLSSVPVWVSTLAVQKRNWTADHTRWKASVVS